jgi:hypothetical protein
MGGYTRASVVYNERSSEAFGVELYNSSDATVEGNSFDFPAGIAGCEIQTLAAGEKIDFSRVVAGAGICSLQRKHLWHRPHMLWDR